MKRHRDVLTNDPFGKDRERFSTTDTQYISICLGSPQSSYNMSTDALSISIVSTLLYRVSLVSKGKKFLSSNYICLVIVSKIRSRPKVNFSLSLSRV